MPTILRRCFLMASLSLLCSFTAQAQAPSEAHRFDFGTALALQTDYQAADIGEFSTVKGFGWLSTQGLLLRERTGPDALRRDFVFGSALATFRITGLKPGRYKLTIISGDSDYGDHRTQVKVEGAPMMPLLDPGLGEYATLTATIDCGASCELNFDSPGNNWVVNSITLEPTTDNYLPTVSKDRVAAPIAWKVPANDPTAPLLTEFRKKLTPAPFNGTKLTRADYLKLISSEIDFWKTEQDANGAIIDPYHKEEWQYSTPAFAHAAAALVVWDNRPDLLENAAKAMDWATLRLSQRKAATGHEDFYAPMLAHAFRLLKDRVDPARAKRWEENLASFDPAKTYRVAPGASNWNIVALSGEAQFQQMGIRPKSNDFVGKSLAAQRVHFGSPYGLYLEGPMAYDLFPRMWLADMLAGGYDGPYRAQIEELMRRGAITSLFMQSPWGELPAGGRSAQHQWNEAEQCATYEIYAAKALAAGDVQLAGIFKRAAHLSLASMQRWVRPSGEMQIVKNWVDPAQSHAFETYSAHSQYNLLPVSMLAIAYERSASTEAVKEQAAPADLGGYALEIPELHKLFANAVGTYVEIDTRADHHYDATGLIRVQMAGLNPQLGPSDSILSEPAYSRPNDSPETLNTGVGVSWKDGAGEWHRLGELAASQIRNVSVSNLKSTPAEVSFDLTYEGELFGVQRIVERYTLTRGKMELATKIPDYKGVLRYVWPVLADDGRTKSEIAVKDGVVTLSRPAEKLAQTFQPIGAQSVTVEDALYPNHNGWDRIGVAEFPQGGTVTLVIQPQPH